MVVTEQQQSASNIATMETACAGQEAPVFGQTGPANELEASRFATPSAWNNATVGQQVSRLGTLSGHTLGPNTLQKVMAGDKISATVQYFYQATPGGSSPISTVVLNTLGQLLSGTNSVSSIVKSNATAITTQLGANLGFIDAVQPTGAGGNIPQAYLTILFFDERFNFISAADGGVAQQQVAGSVGAGGSTLGLGNIKAPKNGYAMVYVSNRSDQPVYFDNLQVGKIAGNILEENHYYAYGLRIAAISSQKFADLNEGETKNNQQFQGSFNEFDEDIGWNDFALRDYDGQIGRFVQADPYNQFPSPYTGMANDPVNFADPSGGLSVNFGTINTLGRIGVAAGGAAAGFAIDKLTGGNGWTGAAIGGLVALGATFIPPFDIGAIGGALKDAAPSLAIHAADIAVARVVNETTNQYVRFASIGGNDNWKPLKKSDLIRYVGSTDDNILGPAFERLFEAFSEKSPLYNSSNVRPNGNVFTGGFRNTAPDFIGDAFVSEKKGRVRVNTTIMGADWYELKQKSGGLYLSSNEDQIAGHIDNLRRNTDYAYRKYGYMKYKSRFYIVTTADVKYSESIYERARKNNIIFTHIHSEYRMVNNDWQFRFSKTIGTIIELGF